MVEQERCQYVKTGSQIEFLINIKEFRKNKKYYKYLLSYVYSIFNKGKFHMLSYQKPCKCLNSL